MPKERTYIAIDLKSFYASVECVERGLDPLVTNLVVADSSRTDKTICLAVSPALKSFGIPGRPRLFEVQQKVREINARRLAETEDKERQVYAACDAGNGHQASSGAGDAGQAATGKRNLRQSSSNLTELTRDPGLLVSFLTAVPQMAKYMEISSRIYSIYLRYVAPEDIHVYSVDEVFMDVTGYLRTYGMTAHAFAMKMIQEVLKETGITATAGIGTNLYLAKIAMDIEAKHIPADKDGVRIAELDERTYRRRLWAHTPITDFWRVGPGYARRLSEVGLFTMGDVARCSLGAPSDYYNEDLLYRIFGKNAELLIDHAWGYEPCTIADIKAYHPENESLGAGQVLMSPYSFAKGEVIVREMAEQLALDLMEKGLVTDQIVLDIGYDSENVTDAGRRQLIREEIKSDRYGRKIPKAAHGSQNLSRWTFSMAMIEEAAVSIYRKEVNPSLLIRRVGISASHVISREDGRAEAKSESYEQLDLFTDYKKKEAEEKAEEERLDREQRLLSAMLDIKKKFGKNAIVKGTSFEDGATGRQRNEQIGGHKA
ncbi:MAG: DNA methylase [Lachnospiraceae bacterium]|nr:DNA methylase [Lachnospiraceae bacterium]